MMEDSPSQSSMPVITVALPRKPGSPRPVTLGVPFPQGMMRQPTGLSLRSPADDTLPVEARTLVAWPDGSVRWALLAFMPTQGGEHHLQQGVASPAIASPVTVQAQGHRITLGNGLASVTLAVDGDGPIHQLIAHGKSMIYSAADIRLVVNRADTTHEPIRKLTVLEQSPMRARVRIEGGHHTSSGQRLLSYRLDVELWAGLPTLRLDYHFFNLEPGADEQAIDHIAIDCRFNLPGRTMRHVQQMTWGMYTVPREVLNPDAVALVVDDRHARALVEDPAMLKDDTDYPFYLRGPRLDMANWMGITTDQGPSVYGQMHEFTQMRPKRLSSDGSRLTLDVWPRRSGRLMLPQGRSRRQTFTLHLSDQPKLPAGQASGQLDALIHEGKACVNHDWFARCQVFDQHRVLKPGRSVRFEKFLARLMKLDIPQSMFDLGDTAETGYQRSYIGAGYVKPVVDDPPPCVYLTSTFVTPASDPLSYEPVWSNNEYDGIFAFCSELMRTGRPELWPVIRQLARHNIEVDFLHHSDHRWLHRATPAHSARHTSTGAYPSHFWTQGLLAYHCLTGDGDALEVATALGDKIIENFRDPEVRPVLWGFNRELGWPVLALSHLVDITHQDNHRQMLEELIDFLVDFDRQGFAGRIKLSSTSELSTMTRQIIEGFFGYASMIEGVDHYLGHTDSPKVKAWFHQLLADLVQELKLAHQQGVALHTTHMHALGMAIALDRLDAPAAVDSGMLSIQELMDSTDWTAPLHEVKAVAMIHRSIIRFLEHARAQGCLEPLEYLRWHA